MLGMLLSTLSPAGFNVLSYVSRIEGALSQHACISVSQSDPFYICLWSDVQKCPISGQISCTFVTRGVNHSTERSSTAVRGVLEK